MMGTLGAAKETWDQLKNDFEGSNRTKRMHVLILRREFETIKMKDHELVTEFICLLKMVTCI